MVNTKELYDSQTWPQLILFKSLNEQKEKHKQKRKQMAAKILEQKQAIVS